MTRSGLAAFALICAITISLSAYAQGTEPHGWLNTETLKTRSGDFEFKNGYPVGDTAQRLLDLQKFNRAVEVYLTQIMLGKLDGRSDRAADRERRDGLCDEPPRPEE